MIEVQAIDLLEEYLAVPLDDLGTAFEGIFADVFRRELDAMDTNFSVGVFLRSHAGQDRPEIGGNGEPAWSRFIFHIQTMVKSTDREQGELWSAQFTKMLRSVLYRNAQFRSSLLALKVGDEPPYDRALKCGVLQTEYASGQISGAMAYMTQIEFFLDAEGI